jgi:hypothetical protein
LGEGGAFEEIGKRGIWASDRHLASTSATLYCAIALDADMAHGPAWMHSVLSLLAARAATGPATSLPLLSFDMEAQHELAFRTLQSGLNIGKIVVRIATRPSVNGDHIVTGGTSGLGLLTGRWLAQRGARCVVLASRSGVLAHGTAAEWEAMHATSAATSVKQCDTSERTHVRRLLTRMDMDAAGVWHAAGVLADTVLPKQKAFALARVHAPKANGAYSLHGALSGARVGAFTLFSSVAALLGGAGQANYSAANTCLDALLCGSERAVGRVGRGWHGGAWRGERADGSDGGDIGLWSHWAGSRPRIARNGNTM